MKKILFDATVLVDGNDMIEERRGIYFVARNLLLEMCRQSQSEIILFASTFKEAGLQRVVSELGINAKPYKKASALSARLHSVVVCCRKKRLEKGCGCVKRILFSALIAFFSVVSTLLYSVINFNCKFDKDTVFFSPRTSAPWFINRRKSIKKFIVLYDLIPVLFHNREMMRWGWFAYLLRTLNGNDTYFAISENTKRDFCGYSKKIRDSQVKVTYCASDKLFCRHSDLEELKCLKEKYGIPESKNFVFSIGAQDKRKNSDRIVRSFMAFKEKNKIDDLVLVVAGSSDNRDDDLVLYRSYVDGKDLPIFYSFAQWFVFTSQYEGFGLPPLDAMQCGCPVIASNNSSIPEVVGDAGLLIDWDSDEQHVDAYGKYYFDETLRKDYAQKGMECAKQFSWEKMTKEILSTIDESYEIC
ncbi:MAG: glycosyltransferase family 4 protein [Fibrobacter sp.]|uniref:glycosyltransferase family 4 protein n=1 Tax=Fibrobacter sp. TaxID=35828 RepID=UPI0025B8DD0E|nr:glycosyltransferase family 1 protein [Fibrobacter sp.]MBR4785324.1 glycosyltransferase family 4 protein [Fibrobacter sp.]